MFYITNISPYVNILLLWVATFIENTSSYSNDLDLSKFLDPVEQFSSDNYDGNPNRRFQKSVFNVPVITEPTPSPCPHGTQRINANKGPCVRIGPTLIFGESFLLQSYSALKNRQKLLSSTTETPVTRKVVHPNKRRRTTFRPTADLSTTTTTESSLIQQEGPTYIVDDNEKLDGQNPKPTVIVVDEDTTFGQEYITSSGSGFQNHAESRFWRIFLITVTSWLASGM